jgi:hypothetical protein
MAPYRTEPGQDSAVIYDMQGELVWTSFTQTAQNVVFDFRPCMFNETMHLCMCEAQQNLGYARGYIGVYDESLTMIKQVKSQNSYAALDQHETALSYNGSALLGMIYNTERADLSAFNITTGVGWIQDSVIQVLDIETNDLLFEWSSIEHIGLDEAMVPPNTTEVVGTGLSATSPWDYFHINSIDENADGDYIISARHTNALYKISGITGVVLWRLGGLRSDFDLLNNLNFSSQHDARWHESNSTHDIISLFDNASNGFTTTADHSQGMILSLDHSASPPTARLITGFPAPEEIPISNSQGNMQLLSPGDTWRDSHTFINWGNVPVVTEHAPDGSILFQAHVEVNNDGMMNYRAYKVPRANLTLTPTDAPALFTYARSASAGNATTMFYMSWNGATEVARWRVLGRGQCDEEWTEISVVDKDGFETTYRAEGYHQFGLVEALREDGSAIRNSTLKGTRTFVPSPLLAGSCEEDGCGEAEEYVVPDEGQMAMLQEVVKVREACEATPQMLEEELERLEVAEEERSSEEQGEEDAAVRLRGMGRVSVAVAAVGALWVLA